MTRQIEKIMTPLRSDINHEFEVVASLRISWAMSNYNAMHARQLANRVRNLEKLVSMLEAFEDAKQYLEGD